MKGEEYIKELKQRIEHEQRMYEIACEYPTDTDQYYDALEKHRVKIEQMKEKLFRLERPLRWDDKAIDEGKIKS
jgi:hypothetical protein